jgi:hypothetical protein
VEEKPYHIAFYPIGNRWPPFHALFSRALSQYGSVQYHLCALSFALAGVSSLGQGRASGGIEKCWKKTWEDCTVQIVLRRLFVALELEVFVRALVRTVLLCFHLFTSYCTSTCLLFCVCQSVNSHVPSHPMSSELQSSPPNAFWRCSCNLQVFRQLGKT